MADMRDVVGRIINQLTLRRSAHELQGNEPVILVARGDPAVAGG